jgi:pimeloyl-ACP methyl ester carboxylesterase
MVRLFPAATQIWVEGGHNIPLEHPEAVIDAIRRVQADQATP